MHSFRVYFFSYTVLVAVPIFLPAAILSFYHISGMTFNGEPAYGWKAVLMCLFFTPLFGLFLASINWLVLRLGSRLYNFIGSKFKTKQL